MHLKVLAFQPWSAVRSQIWFSFSVSACLHFLQSQGWPQFAVWGISRRVHHQETAIPPGRGERCAITRAFMSRRSESGAAGRGKTAPAAASDQDGRTNKRNRDSLDQLSRQDERKPRASMIDGGDRISSSWRDGHGEGARGKSHGGAASGRKSSSAFQDRLSSSQGGVGSKASPPKNHTVVSLLS